MLSFKQNTFSSEKLRHFLKKANPPLLASLSLLNNEYPFTLTTELVSNHVSVTTATYGSSVCNTASKSAILLSRDDALVYQKKNKFYFFLDFYNLNF